MAEIYKFLASYEVLIYILLAIGGMFAFRWLWRSWREWQTAVYSLEREFSSRRLGQSAAISIFDCLLYFVLNFPWQPLSFPASGGVFLPHQHLT